MKLTLLSLLLCTVTASAQGPGRALPPAKAPSAVALTQASVDLPGGGAFITLADAERMVQDRENRMAPTAKRRDFRLDPNATEGWIFTRKALLAMLESMKNKADDAPVYFMLGDTENLDANGKALPGTWHETLIISGRRLFFSLLDDGEVSILQHPNPYP